MHKKLLKIIAGIMTGIMLMSAWLPDAALAQEALLPKALAPSQVHIPASLGHVDQIHSGTNGQTVLFIQDAHDSVQAQIHIAKLITLAVRDYGVKEVIEEGYQGQVPTDEFFKEIRKGSERTRISYQFLDQLRLGGAEFAHINRPRPFKLTGGENLDAYLKNLVAYRESAETREAIEQDLNALRDAFQKLANAHFAPIARDFLKLQKRFRSGEIEILDYINRIEKMNGGMNAKNYPMLEAIIKLQKSESGRGIKMNPVQFWTELTRFESEVALRILPHDKERQVYTYLNALELVTVLNQIKMNAEQYVALRPTLEKLETKSMAEFLAHESKKPVLVSSLWQDLIHRAIRFYDLAKLRDDTAIQSVENVSGPKNPVTVLVFGGFHRANILSKLKELGFSYAVITPTISKISKRHQKLYRERMRADLPEAGPTVSLIAKANRPPSIFIEALNSVRAVQIHSEIRETQTRPGNAGRYPSSVLVDREKTTRSEARADNEISIRSIFHEKHVYWTLGWFAIFRFADKYFLELREKTRGLPGYRSYLDYITSLTLPLAMVHLWLLLSLYFSIPKFANGYSQRQVQRMARRVVNGIPLIYFVAEFVGPFIVPKGISGATLDLRDAGMVVVAWLAGHLTHSTNLPKTVNRSEARAGVNSATQKIFEISGRRGFWAHGAGVFYDSERRTRPVSDRLDSLFHIMVSGQILGPYLNSPASQYGSARRFGPPFAVYIFLENIVHRFHQISNFLKYEFLQIAFFYLAVPVFVSYLLSRSRIPFYGPLDGKFGLTLWNASPYGPYWIILNPKKYYNSPGIANFPNRILQGALRWPTQWRGIPAEDHAGYLVPDRDVKRLKSQLRKAINEGKIRSSDFRAIVSKIISYSEFISSDGDLEKISAARSEARTSENLKDGLAEIDAIVNERKNENLIFIAFVGGGGMGTSLIGHILGHRGVGHFTSEQIQVLEGDQFYYASAGVKVNALAVLMKEMRRIREKIPFSRLLEHKAFETSVQVAQQSGKKVIVVTGGHSYGLVQQISARAEQKIIVEIQASDEMRLKRIRQTGDPEPGVRVDHMNQVLQEVFQVSEYKPDLIIKNNTEYSVEQLRAIILTRRSEMRLFSRSQIIHALKLDESSAQKIREGVTVIPWKPEGYEFQADESFDVLFAGKEPRAVLHRLGKKMELASLRRSLFDSSLLHEWEERDLRSWLLPWTHNPNDITFYPLRESVPRKEFNLDKNIFGFDSLLRYDDVFGIDNKYTHDYLKWMAGQKQGDQGLRAGRRIETIYDFGTGTGALSLAAARITGARDIVAIDFRWRALLATALNAEALGLRDRIRPVYANLSMAQDWERIVRDYGARDFVLADLPYPVLKRFFETLDANYREDGRIRDHFISNAMKIFQPGAEGVILSDEKLGEALRGQNFEVTPEIDFNAMPRFKVENLNRSETRASLIDWVDKNKIVISSSKKEDRAKLSGFFSQILNYSYQKQIQGESAQAQIDIDEVLSKLSKYWSEALNGEIAVWMATASMAFSNPKNMMMRMKSLDALPESVKLDTLFYAMLAMINHIRKNSRHEAERIAPNGLFFLDDLYLTGATELSLEGIIEKYLHEFFKTEKHRPLILDEPVLFGTQGPAMSKRHLYLRGLAAALNPRVHYSVQFDNLHYQEKETESFHDARRDLIFTIKEKFSDDLARLGAVWNEMMIMDWGALGFLPLEQTRIIHAFSPASTLKDGDVASVTLLPKKPFRSAHHNIFSPKSEGGKVLTDSREEFMEALKNDLAIFNLVNRSELREENLVGSLASRMWVNPAIEQKMAVEDLKRMKKILKTGSQFIFERELVLAGAVEFGTAGENKPKRSVLMPLMRPVMDQGQQFDALMLKAVLLDPSNADSAIAMNPLDAYQPQRIFGMKDGKPVFAEAAPRALGGLSFEKAKWEYEATLKLRDKGVPVALPLGYGKFTNQALKLPNGERRELGYVLLLVKKDSQSQQVTEARLRRKMHEPLVALHVEINRTKPWQKYPRRADVETRAEPNLNLNDVEDLKRDIFSYARTLREANEYGAHLYPNLSNMAVWDNQMILRDLTDFIFWADASENDRLGYALRDFGSLLWSLENFFRPTANQSISLAQLLRGALDQHMLEVENDLLRRHGKEFWEAFVRGYFKNSSDAAWQEIESYGSGNAFDHAGGDVRRVFESASKEINPERSMWARLLHEELFSNRSEARKGKRVVRITIPAYDPALDAELQQWLQENAAWVVSPQTKWDQIFPDSKEKPFYVEIGSGSGKHVTELAKAFPGTNFLAIEPDFESVKSLTPFFMEQAGVKNVRLMLASDFRAFESADPQQVADVIYTIHPQPKYSNRYLFKSPEGAKKIMRALKPNGFFAALPREFAHQAWMDSDTWEEMFAQSFGEPAISRAQYNTTPIADFLNAMQKVSQTGGVIVYQHRSETRAGDQSLKPVSMLDQAIQNWMQSYYPQRVLPQRQKEWSKVKAIKEISRALVANDVERVFAFVKRQNEKASAFIVRAIVVYFAYMLAVIPWRSLLTREIQIDTAISFLVCGAIGLFGVVLSLWSGHRKSVSLRELSRDFERGDVQNWIENDLKDLMRKGDQRSEMRLAVAEKITDRDFSGWKKIPQQALVDGMFQSELGLKDFYVSVWMASRLEYGQKLEPAELHYVHEQANRSGYFYLTKSGESQKRELQTGHFYLDSLGRLVYLTQFDPFSALADAEKPTTDFYDSDREHVFQWFSENTNQALRAQVSAELESWVDGVLNTKKTTMPSRVSLMQAANAKNIFLDMANDFHNAFLTRESVSADTTVSDYMKSFLDEALVQLGFDLEWLSKLALGARIILKRKMDPNVYVASSVLSILSALKSAKSQPLAADRWLQSLDAALKLNPHLDAKVIAEAATSAKGDLAKFNHSLGLNRSELRDFNGALLLTSDFKARHEVVASGRSAVERFFRELKFKRMAIAGTTGVGKTTLSQVYRKQYGDKLALIESDWSLKSREERTQLLKQIKSGFEPESIISENWDQSQYAGWIREIQAFEAGKAASSLLNVSGAYDRSSGKKERSLSVPLSKDGVVIAEGMTAVTQETKGFFDVKVFLDVSDDHILLNRAIAREGEKPEAKRQSPEFIRERFRYVDLQEDEEVRGLVPGSFDYVLDLSNYDNPVLYKVGGRSETRILDYEKIKQFELTDSDRRSWFAKYKLGLVEHAIELADQTGATRDVRKDVGSFKAYGFSPNGQSPSFFVAFPFAEMEHERDNGYLALFNQDGEMVSEGLYSAAVLPTSRNKMFMLRFQILPEFRGRGYGREMVAALRKFTATLDPQMSVYFRLEENEKHNDRFRESLKRLGFQDYRVDELMILSRSEMREISFEDIFSESVVVHGEKFTFHGRRVEGHRHNAGEGSIAQAYDFGISPSVGTNYFQIDISADGAPAGQFIANFNTETKELNSIVLRIKEKHRKKGLAKAAYLAASRHIQPATIKEEIVEPRTLAMLFETIRAESSGKSIFAAIKNQGFLQMAGFSSPEMFEKALSQAQKAALTDSQALAFLAIVTTLIFNSRYPFSETQIEKTIMGKILKNAGYHHLKVFVERKPSGASKIFLAADRAPQKITLPLDGKFGGYSIRRVLFSDGQNQEGPFEVSSTEAGMKMAKLLAQPEKYEMTVWPHRQVAEIHPKRSEIRGFNLKNWIVSKVESDFEKVLADDAEKLIEKIVLPETLLAKGETVRAAAEKAASKVRYFDNDRLFYSYISGLVLFVLGGCLITLIEPVGIWIRSHQQLVEQLVRGIMICMAVLFYHVYRNTGFVIGLKSFDEIYFKKDWLENREEGRAIFQHELMHWLKVQGYIENDIGTMAAQTFFVLENGEQLNHSRDRKKSFEKGQVWMHSMFETGEFDSLASLSTTREHGEPENYEEDAFLAGVAWEIETRSGDRLPDQAGWHFLRVISNGKTATEAFTELGLLSGVSAQSQVENKSDVLSIDHPRHNQFLGIVAVVFMVAAHLLSKLFGQTTSDDWMLSFFKITPLILAFTGFVYLIASTLEVVVSLFVSKKFIRYVQWASLIGVPFAFAAYDLLFLGGLQRPQDVISILTSFVMIYFMNRNLMSWPQERKSSQDFAVANLDRRSEMRSIQQAEHGAIIGQHEALNHLKIRNLLFQISSSVLHEGAHQKQLGKTVTNGDMVALFFEKVKKQTPALQENLKVMLLDLFGAENAEVMNVEDRPAQMLLRFAAQHLKQLDAATNLQRRSFLSGLFSFLVAGPSAVSGLIESFIRSSDYDIWLRYAAIAEDFFMSEGSGVFYAPYGFEHKEKKEERETRARLSEEMLQMVAPGLAKEFKARLKMRPDLLRHMFWQATGGPSEQWEPRDFNPPPHYLRYSVSNTHTFTGDPWADDLDARVWQVVNFVRDLTGEQLKALSGKFLGSKDKAEFSRDVHSEGALRQREAERLHQVATRFFAAHADYFRHQIEDANPARNEKIEAEAGAIMKAYTEAETRRKRFQDLEETMALFSKPFDFGALSPAKRSEARANFDRAVSILEEVYALDRGDVSRKQLAHAKAMAEVILKKRSIQKIMIVGIGSRWLADLLWLMGKEVVLVTVDAPLNRAIRSLQESKKPDFQSLGVMLAPYLVLDGEIGTLNLERNNLAPHSFDLVTMVDLIGGSPTGNPKQWLESTRHLLKTGTAYFLGDMREGEGGYSIAAQIHSVFPERKNLTRGKAMTGDYDPYGENHFFEVKNPPEGRVVSNGELTGSIKNQDGFITHEQTVEAAMKLLWPKGELSNELDLPIADFVQFIQAHFSDRTKLKGVDLGMGTGWFLTQAKESFAKAQIDIEMLGTEEKNDHLSNKDFLNAQGKASMDFVSINSPTPVPGNMSAFTETAAQLVKDDGLIYVASDHYQNYHAVRVLLERGFNVAFITVFRNGPDRSHYDDVFTVVVASRKSLGGLRYLNSLGVKIVSVQRSELRVKAIQKKSSHLRAQLEFRNQANAVNETATVWMDARELAAMTPAAWLDFEKTAVWKEKVKFVFYNTKLISGTDAGLRLKQFQNSVGLARVWLGEYGAETIPAIWTDAKHNLQFGLSGGQTAMLSGKKMYHIKTAEEVSEGDLATALLYVWTSGQKPAALWLEISKVSQFVDRMMSSYWKNLVFAAAA